MASNNPHDLRTIIAFGLNLADSIGAVVQGINADDFGNVTLYAWDQGADAIDAIADREGWSDERLHEGSDKLHGRRHSFLVAGRPVRVDLIARVEPAVVTA